MSAPRVLVVMGVSGVGKTTIAVALAKELGWPFEEGDDLHPAANIAKMRAGNPLTDEDRAPWLAAVRGWIDGWLAAGRSGVITCSALKRRYRDFLCEQRPTVEILYLHADEATIEQRMEHRTGHFMPVSLLESQLHTLEEPAADEHVIRVEVAGEIADVVDAAIAAIAAHDARARAGSP